MAAVPPSETSTPIAEGSVPDLPSPSRSGLWLFACYLMIYLAFVAVAAFWGRTLAQVPFGGVNLAIWWGLALIFLPLILALVYLRTVRRGE